MRVCKKCGVEKPLTSFAFQRNRNLRVYSCKECLYLKQLKINADKPASYHEERYKKERIRAQSEEAKLYQKMYQSRYRRQKKLEKASENCMENKG